MTKSRKALNGCLAIHFVHRAAQSPLIGSRWTASWTLPVGSYSRIGAAPGEVPFRSSSPRTLVQAPVASASPLLARKALAAAFIATAG